MNLLEVLFPNALGGPLAVRLPLDVSTPSVCRPPIFYFKILCASGDWPPRAFLTDVPIDFLPPTPPFLLLLPTKLSPPPCTRLPRGPLALLHAFTLPPP